MRPAKYEYVFCCGRKFQIEFYFSENGRMPAKELLINSHDQKVAVKLTALAKLIADTAVLYDEKKYRIVERKHRIYEFKVLAYRFFSFFSSGGGVIITNGYMKKSKKVDRRELSRAIRLKIDYLERVERSVYYEKT